LAKPDHHLEKLVARLRSLEAEALRLASIDLPPSQTDQLTTYQERLEKLEKSHSRSWFGDHASTYFGQFEPPPGGRSFDVEWGFVPGFNGSHNPGWETYSRDEIRKFVFADIGETIFHTMHDLGSQIDEGLSTLRDQALDVLEALTKASPSKAIERYTKTIDSDLAAYTVPNYISDCAGNTPNMTRDSEEIAKGKNVPAHVQYQAPFQTLDVNRRRLRELASTLRKTIQAVELNAEIESPKVVSDMIFIGHGRSNQWLVLKDFLKERLHLPFEEFNRVPPAGISTQERLDEMLSKCGFAFLVFTAEDAHSDETLHARENVIHEAGLFQGRLGWRRAIVLLEDGCEEFSNIVGLGQIRFQKENIASCFEEVRRVLEREGFLKA
jgi:predicted nucleotide-binding protein